MRSDFSLNPQTCLASVIVIAYIAIVLRFASPLRSAPHVAERSEAERSGAKRSVQLTSSRVIVSWS